MKTNKILKRTIISVAISTSLLGCKTIEGLTNTDVATIVGAFGGGVTGSYICRKSGLEHAKELCAAGGALLGGLIGRGIGQYLDEQDQIRMAKNMQKTLSTGKPQSWSNPETKTSGTAKIIETKQEFKPVKVAILKEKVSQVPPLEIIGETYKASNKANLRGGPGTDYEIVGALTSGQVTTVVGKVKTKEWYLLSDSGVGSGFVYAPLMKPAPGEEVPIAEDQLTDAEVVETEIAATRVCRRVEQSITLADGSTKSESIDACQGPNGWEIQA